ncbi:hypothetical protein BHM03_00011338 [Ensete ventricosum]|nr:hypothetical protein BHM03_00011338 [Ensete ventricosum]
MHPIGASPRKRKMADYWSLRTDGRGDGSPSEGRSENKASMQRRLPDLAVRRLKDLVLVEEKTSEELERMK